MPEKKDACLVVLSAIAAEDQEVNFAEFGADACIAKGPFKMTGQLLGYARKGRYPSVGGHSFSSRKTALPYPTPFKGSHGTVL
jgi:hypothetical protein